MTWKAKPADINKLDWDEDTSVAARLAYLECGLHHKLWNEEELADYERRILGRYVWGIQGLQKSREIPMTYRAKM